MKKPASILISSMASLVTLTLSAVPAIAQTADPRIAYDQCWADASTWEMTCYIGTVISGYDSLVTYGLTPKWSRDGSRIVFANGDLFLLTIADNTITNLTNDPTGNVNPVWSHDGSRIAFASYRDGDGIQDIYVIDPQRREPHARHQHGRLVG